MATIYCTATSLDGFIADDRESLTWLFSTPFHADDPTAKGDDDDKLLHFDRFFSGVGALVCGANTFAWLERELTADGGPLTWPYEIPSWVVTHRDHSPVDGVEFFSGDMAQLHPRLVEAAAGADVWVIGGGDLAGQFADRGLLDRLWIHQCPVTLGAGRPLLPRRLRLNRAQVETDGQFTAMLFDVVGPEQRQNLDSGLASSDSRR